MNYIYYCSSANNDIYPNNSSTQFSTKISQQSENFLPYNDLEAAVASISFVNLGKLSSNEEVMRIALKSNLTSNVLSSGEWDNIIAWFSIGSNSIKEKSLVYEFDNPTFFPTSKECLMNATFELANIYNNSKSVFKNNSETLIKIIVRQSVKRMKTPFNIHLDSDCPVSKDYFPNNSPTNFTIQLPQRLEFNRDWIIALKNFGMQNSFYNVFDCYITVGNQTYQLEDGVYETDGEILIKLNVLMSGKIQFRGIPSNVKLNGGKVYIRAFQNIEDVITISKNLSNILGFGNSQLNIKLNSGKSVLGDSKIDAKALVPRQLAINCDIIEHSLFADELKQILRVITLPGNYDESFLHFDFTNNEYLKLVNKSFDRIKINITDVKGNPIHVSGKLSSRLQIVFLNINSL